MPNSSLLQSSDTEHTEEINIFGHNIRFKNYCCSYDGVNYEKYSEKVKIRLSICPVSFCPSKCDFCINDSNESGGKINLKYLEKTLRLLKENDMVSRISITGGEPFTDFGILNETINMIYNIFGNIEVSLNTNGYRLRDIMRLDKLRYIEQLHISRHHYDDEKNNEIFHMKMPGRDELKELFDDVIFKDLFFLNCMMLKGYIDSTEEVKKYLDFTGEVGAYKASFITAMPCNKFAAERSVEYTDVINDSLGDVLLTTKLMDHDYCRCQDGIYIASNGAVVNFYGRKTSTHCRSYCAGLVYTPDDELKTGFSGKILLKNGEPTV